MSRATRSQLTLPDLNFTLLSQSPLKQARNARQNDDAPPETMRDTYFSAARADAEEGSSKQHRKRPSSPDTERILEQVNERVAKKPKNNESDSTGDSLISGKPVSTSSLPPQPSPQFRPISSPNATPRAQSVPARSAVPHLDLSRVPPSPSKQRATERLRFTSVPPEGVMPTIITTLPSSGELSMARSQDRDLDVQGEVAPLPALAFGSPPATPVAAGPFAFATTSPLTPLPPTPFVHSSAPGSTVKYQDVVVAIKQDVDQDDATQQASSRAKTPTPASRIPRPSTASSILSAKKGVVSKMRPKTPTTPSRPSSPSLDSPSKPLPPKTPTRVKQPAIPGSSMKAKTPARGRPSTPGPSRSKTPAADVKTPGPSNGAETRRSRTPAVIRSRPHTPMQAEEDVFNVTHAAEPQSFSQDPSTPKVKPPVTPSPVPVEKDIPPETTNIDAAAATAQQPDGKHEERPPVAGPSSTKVDPPTVAPTKVATGSQPGAFGTNGLTRRPLPRKKPVSSSTDAKVAGRITRSASLRQQDVKARGDKKQDEEKKEPEIRRPVSVVGVTSAAQAPSSTPSVSAVKTPMRGRSATVSITRPTASSAAKSNPSSPVKSRPPASTATSRPSMGPSRPQTSMSVHRPPNSTSAASSSGALSTLSLALEKLNMPPPSRPNSSVGFNRANTSLGFNREKGKGADLMDVDSEPSQPSRTSVRSAGDNSRPKTHHKSASNATPGTSNPSSQPTKPGPIRRTNTIGHTGVSIGTKDNTKQKTSLMPPPPVPSTQPVTAPTEVKKSISLHNGMVSGKAKGGFIFGNNKPGAARGIFGVAALPSSMQPGSSAVRDRVVHRVSKQSSLPVVEGSPVKGGERDADGDVAMDSPEPLSDSEVRPSVDSNPFAPRPSTATPVHSTGDMMVPIRDAEHDGEAEVKDPSSNQRKNQSRRASQAHQFLSESLSSLPQTPPRKAPATEGKGKGRADSNGQSSSRTEMNRRSAPGVLGGTNGNGARVSTRRAAAAAAAIAITPPVTDKPPKVSTPGSSQAPGVKQKTLKILRECNVFVDVRTDDGDDAGSLFVEMLKGLGARILSRVGQTCTHIIYKNGLMSTLTRYRLLNTPKPAVVGIGWVVECVEQRARVDEAAFLIDIEGASIAGSNKRRRSMLPKHLLDSPERPKQTAPQTAQAQDGAVVPSNTELSSSPSSEGATVDRSLDDLPPLERARRRQSTMHSRARTIESYM